MRFCLLFFPGRHAPRRLFCIFLLCCCFFFLLRRAFCILCSSFLFFRSSIFCLFLLQPQNRRHNMPADTSGRTGTGALSQRHPDDTGFLLQRHLRFRLSPLCSRRFLSQILVGALHRPFIAKPCQIIIVRMLQHLF